MNACYVAIFTWMSCHVGNLRVHSPLLGVLPASQTCGPLCGHLLQNSAEHFQTLISLSLTHIIESHPWKSGWCQLRAAHGGLDYPVHAPDDLIQTPPAHPWIEKHNKHLICIVKSWCLLSWLFLWPILSDLSEALMFFTCLCKWPTVSLCSWTLSPFSYRSAQGWGHCGKPSNPENRHLPDIFSPADNPIRCSSFKSVSMRMFWRGIRWIGYGH